MHKLVIAGVLRLPSQQGERHIGNSNCMWLIEAIKKLEDFVDRALGQSNGFEKPNV